LIVINQVISIPSSSVIPLGSGGEHLGGTETRRAAAAYRIKRNSL